MDTIVFDIDGTLLDSKCHGDTVWDVHAAHGAGLPVICLLTGGISRAELEDAGAEAVYDDPCDLLRHLDAALRHVARR